VISLWANGRLPGWDRKAHSGSAASPGRATSAAGRPEGKNRTPQPVRAFVAVDGGLSDNPRPELYGAKYSVHAVRASRAPMELVTVVGRHCEPAVLTAAKE